MAEFTVDYSMRRSPRREEGAARCWALARQWMLGTGHATCTIKVTFRPTTRGAKSEVLNVNGRGGGLRTVSLTGTGT